VVKINFVSRKIKKRREIMSELVLRLAERLELVDLLMVKIVEARRRLETKEFNSKLINALSQYLERPSEEEKDNQLYQEPVKYFFNDKILPEVGYFTADPTEYGEIIAMLLERLVLNLTTTCHQAMRRKDSTARL